MNLVAISDVCCQFIEDVDLPMVLLNKRGRPERPSACLECNLLLQSSLFLGHAALFDTSFLAGKATKIVKFSATHFTVFVNGD